jgi:hypothetical protein
VVTESLQLQTYHQLGFTPRCAPGAALYVPGQIYDPATAPQRLLAYGRSVLDSRRTVYKKLLTELFSDSPTEISFPEAGLPYGEWSQWKACVFFPWNFHSWSFLEFYALSVPLFVPANRLLYSIERSIHFWSQDPEHYFSNPNRTGLKVSFPSPFWSKQTGVSESQLAFWSELANFRMRKGCIAFDSFLSLRARVENGDFVEEHARMRVAYLLDVRKTVEETTAALLHVLFKR